MRYLEGSKSFRYEIPLANDSLVTLYTFLSSDGVGTPYFTYGLYDTEFWERIEPVLVAAYDAALTTGSRSRVNMVI